MSKNKSHKSKHSQRLQELAAAKKAEALKKAQAEEEEKETETAPEAEADTEETLIVTDSEIIAAADASAEASAQADEKGSEEAKAEEAEEEPAEESEEDEDADEEEDEEDEEEEPVKEKPAPAKIAFTVTCFIVLAALLFGIISGGMKLPATGNSASGSTAATVPADGNPDDVTCKGSYTAADKKVIGARDKVVATCGDKTLTVGQLQVYYWMEVRNFLGQYGAYAAYFGLDYTQGLDTQICGISEESMTWQQYFLQCALENWHTYQSMAAAGEASGYVLGEEYQENLDAMLADLEAAAVEYEYDGAEGMVHKSLGAAAEVEDYVHFMEVYYTGFGYYNEVSASVQPTDAELDAYFTERSEEYAAKGLTQDSLYVNVRHVLITPVADENSETGDLTDENWAAAEQRAQELLAAWQAGEATEDSFAAMANEHSEDLGSNTNGGLYTDVTEGEMVDTFNDWCFDPERQIGDVGIVRTTYGFHIMYFSGSRPEWPDVVRQDMTSEKLNALVEEASENYPLTVNYKNILLALAEL